jgi:fungal STAND N-terminal Goodbye domain
VNICDIDKQLNVVAGVVHGPSILTLYRRLHPIISPGLPFPPSERSPPSQSLLFSHSSTTFDMSDQPRSSRLRVLFDAALENYKQQTGIDLADHPLAERLQHCNSVESVTAVLREQAQDFEEFQEKDKILKPLKKVLTVLQILPSAADHIAQYVGLVRP